MKLLSIFLFVACMAATARSTGQTITFSGKNVPLTKLFSVIKEQTGYVFFYDKALLQQAKPVSLQVKDAALETVLNQTFSNQPFSFSIVNKTITIVAKPSPEHGPVIASDEGAKQPALIDLTGRVTDTEGKPLEGATVTVKGTNIATKTDAGGVFMLKGIDEDATLEISYAEYETVIVKVNKRTSIAISLKQEIGKLGEVVINKGYYTEKQRFTVGNAGTIKAADIEKQPITNPLLALQGRIPGIQITQLNGLNGGAVQVRIQGRNSLQSGLEPFIVIDGVPFPSQLYLNNMDEILQGSSPLNFINPNDIESIDVLKDADATAIYGSRAANGAILITTKKGKAGKSRLNVSFQQGWSKVTRFAAMLNTRQYLDMRYEALQNDGLTASADPNVGFPELYAPDLTIWDTTRYTNWQKELIGGTAKYTNVNAGISGGNANMNYLIGATFNRQTTVFPGDFDDKKAGLHFNLNTASANQKLTIGLTGSYMYDQNHLPGVDLTSRAVYLEPVAPPLYNKNGTLNWAPDDNGNSTWLNPLANIENSDFNNTTRSLVSNMTLNYKILPGLTVVSSFGYTNLQADLYTPYRLEFYRPEDRVNQERMASYGMRAMSSWIMEPQLRYSGRIGKGKLDGLLGASMQKSTGGGLQVSGYGFTNDQLMRSVSSAPSKYVDFSQSSNYKYLGVFGRLNYTWDEKYILSVNARRDGSSRFGDKSKFHNFWSIGTGWIFSQEKWFQQHVSFMSFGKLRASYGTTGNDQISDYAYTTLYEINNPVIAYQGTSGLRVTRIPNPHLQWEETKKWQSGVDLGFVKDRIVLGISYAQNQSSNQLISYILPDITGFPSINKNLPATIRNTSWEFTLHTVNIKASNLNWISDFNLTIPTNKLMKFPNIELTSYASGFLGAIIGQPLGVKKTYSYAGVDPATGDYMLLDNNGNATLTPNNSTDLNKMVTPRQQYYGGWQNKFDYKGWQLDVLFQFVYQIASNEVYYGNPGFYPGSYAALENGANQPVTILNHWQKPGDEAVIAKFSTTQNYFRRVTISDKAYNYDASFIRLKNVSLSWQLPAGWMKTIKIQSGSVFFRGENLATITKFAGMDPESQSATNLPPLQVWTIGASLEL